MAYMSRKKMISKKIILKWISKIKKKLQKLNFLFQKRGNYKLGMHYPSTLARIYCAYFECKHALEVEAADLGAAKKISRYHAARI